MKSKVTYICTECGYTSSKWLGKCPECDNWNTFDEEVITQTSSSKPLSPAKRKTPTPIKDISLNSETRFPSGISELDRVLGGGIVEGSLVLVSGEPGIGKSTLLLQICNAIEGNVLYVSGEESEAQIKIRAQRLNVMPDTLSLLCDTNLDNAISAIETIKPKVAIVDSVQTISSEEISSAPGSVSQIREVTMALMRTAKSLGITVFIVGHVTKDGTIAGPKILEHMVDCVIYFEGDNTHAFRLLRAAKNRFGSTNEVGIFEMNDNGLECVPNPSNMLINEEQIMSPGTCITCTMEGARPILSEIQALVTPSFFPSPRRTASGVDYNRVTLLLAVLEKKLNLNIANYDAYVNVAGGMKLTEPSCDLAIALSIYSNRKDIIIDNKTVVFGEVGLLGEVRSVSFIESRIKEARKLGCNKFIIPYSNLNKLKDKNGVIGVKTISEAIKSITN